MADLPGPRQIYTLEVVFECLHDLQHLKFTTPLCDLDEHEKEWQLMEFCAPLLRAIKHPTDHFQLADLQLSSLLPLALKQHPSALPLTQTSKTTTDVSKARYVLSRFPRVPQRLFTLPLNNSNLIANKGTIWDGIKDGRWTKYLVPEARSHFHHRLPDDPTSYLQLVSDLQDIAWENLYVTTYIDTNNMIFLLKIAFLGHTPDLEFARSFLRYVNLLAELVDKYEKLVDAVDFGAHEPFEDSAPSVQALKSALFPADTDGHEQGLSMLKVFLWSAWQRSIMLYFYYVIGVQLWQGTTSTWSTLLAVRGIRRLIDLDSRDYRGESTQYLCNWAFELLRTSRTSLALDFRRMIALFDDHFKGLDGRCIKDSDSSCKGDLAESCQRFTSAEAKSQSAHATTCNGRCSRIRWSEAAYRKCASPRAVLADESHSTLYYAKASSNTMAISHVWSHGQGGRPEDGINICLHQRYCRLASSLGCETYWIDSACIPDDPQLRKEAIMTINDIFRDSKATIVSDQDLQSKAVTGLSTNDLETLFSILLACDWGVRAWTMLEAIRGNESIHILCADDQTVRLVDLLRRIHNDGAVDLAVLLGSAQHLLPSSDPGSAKSIEETGYLLSQRHASRKNDEIVIWGLLSNLSARGDALQLWQGHDEVNTGFLVSSAPRTKGFKGYGWAPETPYIRPQQRSVDLGDGLRQLYSIRFPSYDGRGSYAASITPRGLLGKWFVLELDEDAISNLCENCQDERSSTLWLDEGQDLESSSPTADKSPDTKFFPRPDFANACNILKACSSNPIAQVRILRPLDADGIGPYNGGNRRGEDFVVPIVICVCINPIDYGDHDEWQWQGVYEWIDDSHPDWRPEEMMII